MTELLIYSFMAFALAWVVGHSHVSYPFRLALSKAGALGRVIVTMLECVGCFGFWEGLCAHLLHLAPSPLNHWWEACFFTIASNLVLARFAGVVDGSAPEGGADDDRR